MKKFLFFCAAMLVALTASAATNVPNTNFKNNLKSAVADAAAGDVLELGDGIYYEEGNFDMKKNLTIQAAAGAHPIIANLYYFRVEGGANVTFKGIEFDGSIYKNGAEAEITGSTDHCVRSYKAASGTEALTFEDCEFHGYKSYVLYTHSEARKWHSLTVRNCYFHNNVKHGIAVCHEAAGGNSLDELVVENSTFANTEGSYNAIAIVAGNATTLSVDHCTFYNYGSSFVSAPVDVTTLTVKNCIFANPDAKTSAAVSASAGSVTYCLANNTGAYAGVTTDATDISGDPAFVDAADGNYTLGATSPALAAGTDASNLGDPRWWPVKAGVNVATFENETGSIATSTENPYWYGIAPIQSDENEWISGDFTFTTFNDDAWGPSYFYDFVVSNDKSTVYTDYAHAYRSAQGGAYEGNNFAVWYNNFYGNSPIKLAAKATVPGCFVCNCAYTVNSMANGDGYCKKYAKDSYYRILFIGKANDVVTDTVIVAMAENGTYIDKWTYVDLSKLGEVDEIDIDYKTSDGGTPTYFCVDNFGVEEPASYVEPARAKFDLIAGFENEIGGINLTAAESAWQGADAPALGWNNWKSGDYNFMSYYGGNSGYGDYFSAFTVTNETANTSTGSAEPYRSAKGGAYEGSNFAVWNLNYYGLDSIAFEAKTLNGFFINNTAYAVNSMSKGDGWAKKFDATDWFKLTITGQKDNVKGASVDFYLAKDGKFVNEWTYVDLSSLGEVDAIKFTMSSSDETGGYMNTPAYFAMDNFGAAKPASYVAPAMAEFDLTTAIDNTNAAVKTTKMIRDGQVIILRDGKAFNILGAEL